MKKKGKNNVKTGREKEKDFKVKVLEPRGYFVDRTVRKAIYLKGRVFTVQNDFFGCFDLQACRHDACKHIQITAEPGARLQKMRDILAKVDIWPQSCDIEVVLWFGGRKRKKKIGEGEMKAQLYVVWRLNHKTRDFDEVAWIEANGKIIKGDY